MVNQSFYDRGDCCTFAVSVALLLIGTKKKTWSISHFMIEVIADHPGF